MPSSATSPTANGIHRSEAQRRHRAAWVFGFDLSEQRERAADSPLARPLADLLLLGYGPKSAAERVLRGLRGVGQAFIGGSWAARYSGDNGAFPHDIDVIVVGAPDRDDVTDAVVEAMRALGQDAQVIFRSPVAWRQARDAFTRTAKAGPLVELDLSEAA